MNYILSQSSRQVLERFAARRVLLAFDYDGTLAPIVADRDRAFLRPATRKVLAQAARRYPCAVISGRARPDVLRLLGGVKLACVVGNHGLEWEQTAHAASIERQVRAWLTRMETLLADIPGLVIEDKRYSLTVHFRRARRKAQAAAAIRQAAASLGKVRIIGGDHVVNVVHPAAPHKGKALQRIQEMLQCPAAIYIGDDVTDEDVFALRRPQRLLSIRVGASRRSKAPYYIRNQQEIDELLACLLSLREEPSPGRRLSQ